MNDREPTTIRLWANETRGAAAGSKSYCHFCGRPITWMLTKKNMKKLALDGHRPTPLFTTTDPENGRTVEVHSRRLVHVATCPHRPEARA